MANEKASPPATSPTKGAPLSGEAWQGTDLPGFAHSLSQPLDGLVCDGCFCQCMLQILPDTHVTPRVLNLTRGS